MPSREDSSGSSFEQMTAHVPAHAATTSPMRAAMASLTGVPTGPNRPSLMASSRDMTQARSPSASRQVASTSSAAPGLVYTCLTRASPPSSATPSRSGEPSASASIRSSGPTFTMPWSAVTYITEP